jgi:hyperosmotically inducible periplasmic protein
MKQILICFCTAALFTVTACKNKAKETTTITPVDTSINTTAPVQVNNDDVLRNGVRDATKDFPGVQSTVANGEIILSGEINRTDWQRLMPALQALNPARVNSDKLTIK